MLHLCIKKNITMGAKRVLMVLMVAVTTLVVLEVSYTNFRGVVTRASPENIQLISLNGIRHQANKILTEWNRSDSLQVVPQDDNQTLLHDALLSDFPEDFVPRRTKVICLKTSKESTSQEVYLPAVEGDGVFFARTATNKTCFTSGTNVKETIADNTKTSTCVCKTGWSGELCSIPQIVSEAIQKLPKLYHTAIKPRLKARRIIQAFPFNMEFDLLETRLAEYGDLVDVFLVLESNYTAYGTPKERYLNERLKQGMYKDLACKLVYVFLDYFPPEAKRDGWITDALHRNFIGESRGFQRLANVSPGDVVILTDADEIPSRDAILFLKFHDGYPEPFGFTYKWTLYGFFWENLGRGTHEVCGGMTSGMLQNVLHRKMYTMRDPRKIGADLGALNAYIKTGRKVIPRGCWMLGNSNHPAGYHCSWCLNAEGIRNKLVSAQNGDFPRWGDYDKKCRIPYIEHLVKTGTWFDDKTRYHQVDGTKSGNAPPYVLQNKNKYSHLIVNPYAYV